MVGYPSGAETGMTRENQISTIAADALASEHQQCNNIGYAG